MRAPVGAVADVHVPATGRGKVSAADGARPLHMEHGCAVYRVTHAAGHFTSGGQARTADGHRSGQPATEA
ncbi:hypothetical protein [Streptomyces sp. NPDC057877]|uniref:hypothetical protein n=1 Tax=Streptomyces sp. NPDC057877 TaxID=3346269 RepID=UPI0036B8DF6A